MAASEVGPTRTRSGPVRARNGSRAADRGGPSTPPPLRSAPCSPRSRARPWRLLALRSAFAECAKLCCTAGVAQSVARASASALGRAACSRTLFVLCTPPSTAPSDSAASKCAHLSSAVRFGPSVGGSGSESLHAKHCPCLPAVRQFLHCRFANATSVYTRACAGHKSCRAAPCGSDTGGLTHGRRTGSDQIRPTRTRSGLTRRQTDQIRSDSDQIRSDQTQQPWRR